MGPIRPADNYLNMFDRISTINYGKLISSGAAEKYRCYNAKTGQILWNYTVEDPYTEFTIGNNWWMQQAIHRRRQSLPSDKLNTLANQPLPRGAPFICIDIETGKSSSE